MIVAVPEQRRSIASGIGIPEHPVIITCWRFWCSVCRYSPKEIAASHAQWALEQGDFHAAREQCHTEGQLELFALAGGAR